MTEKEFDHIYNNYFGPIRNYLFYKCGNIDLASDTAQEVFLKVLQTGSIEQEKVKGLLFKMASNMLANKYQRAKLETNYLNTLQTKGIGQTPEDEFEFGELKTFYENTLAKMPEKQRVVFMMSRNENLKYEEIAERLGISVQAVGKRMAKALSVLQNALNQYYGE